MTRHRPRASVTAGALVTALALGGCSLGYEPPGAPARTSPGSSPPAAISTSVSPSGEGSTPSSIRQRYSGRVSRTTACASGTTTVDGTGQVVRLTGDCATVRVTGTGVVVLADRVTTLEVDATGATVVVTTVEQVTLAGTTNVVVWEDGNPQVTDTGTANEAHRESP